MWPERTPGRASATSPLKRSAARAKRGRLIGLGYVDVCLELGGGIAGADSGTGGKFPNSLDADWAECQMVSDSRHVRLIETAGGILLEHGCFRTVLPFAQRDRLPMSFGISAPILPCKPTPLPTFDQARVGKGSVHRLTDV